MATAELELTFDRLKLFRKKLDKTDYPTIRYGLECTHAITLEAYIDGTKFNTSVMHTHPKLLKPDFLYLKTKIKEESLVVFLPKKIEYEIYIFNNTCSSKKASFVVINPSDYKAIARNHPSVISNVPTFFGCDIFRSSDISSGDCKIG